MSSKRLVARAHCWPLASALSIASTNAASEKEQSISARQGPALLRPPDHKQGRYSKRFGIDPKSVRKPKQNKPQRVCWLAAVIARVTHAVSSYSTNVPASIQKVCENRHCARQKVFDKNLSRRLAHGRPVQCLCVDSASPLVPPF